MKRSLFMTLSILVVCAAVLVGDAQTPMSDIDMLLQANVGRPQAFAVLVPPDADTSAGNLTEFWTTNQLPTNGDWPNVTNFHGGDLLGYCTGRLVIYKDETGYANMKVKNFIDFRGKTYHITRWDQNFDFYIYCPEEYDYVYWYFGGGWDLPSRLSKLRQSHDINWEMTFSSPFGGGTGGSTFTIHPGY